MSAIIGTLEHTENSSTRFFYDDSDILAIHFGCTGHCDGEEEKLASVENFGEACHWVATHYSPYGKNPNFYWQGDARNWWLFYKSPTSSKETAEKETRS